MGWLWKGTGKIYGETGEVKNEYGILQRNQQLCSGTFFSYFYSGMFFYFKTNYRKFWEHRKE